uniref:4a-hydroxytetrahydrobiopterin dehydratase n=1 Tax=Paulinella micropora TaxID=1928728 RepID=A0A1L5YDB5_9EUKA|nr:hypothetical protein PCKR_904 [Paulinella micropora]AQX45431.1 hypothetical protein PFK_904 [Paulinella micropora]
MAKYLDAIVNQSWTQRQRPERLERRIEFTDYQDTRNFLDKLNTLSQNRERFPDISFGRTYVNLTLHVKDNMSSLDSLDHDFAQQIDDLL